MYSSRYAAAILAAAVMASCQDSPVESNAPHGGPPASRQAVDPGQVHLSPLEMQFAEIEESVPGFAGWYFDKDGNAVVRVKDAGHQVAAIERVGRILDARGQAGRGAAKARTGRPVMSARPAKFSFTELARYREGIRKNMTEGVYSIDLDEVRNQVSIGVRDEAAAQRFRAAAVRLGLPGAAVHVWLAPEPQLRASLASSQRPIRGGIKHTWASGTYCSVGINGAWAHSTDYAGYITASHCSNTYMGLDGSTTYYHQPSIVMFNLYRVGYEFDDPQSYTGGACPVGAGCRRSDAMFVRYLPEKASSANGFNTIFRTTTWGRGGRGSLEISGHFTIVAQTYSNPVNEELEKVGATSGWTYGYVTETCVDKFSGLSDYAGRPAWVLCNEITDIWSEPGDSGAPVFKWYGDTVHWAGIMWAGPANNYNETWHSNTYNVTWELYSYGFYF
jgi:hypothetical protein